jgi:hypothetical protein
MFMKTCPKCNSLHNKIGTFCSRTCANSRSWSENDKKKKAQSFVNSSKTIKRTYINVSCKCGKNFNCLPYKLKKFCSRECVVKFGFIPPGGLRKGAGRGKHGWYKGFYLDSNYELAYLIYCLDHNIKIERNKKSFKYIDSSNKERKFYPDFRVNGKLTEIKGYYTTNLNAKINSVDEPIDVFFLKDLKDIFNYVENKTKLKIHNLYRLYE